jgi:histone deacetylase complex regulatory component SIN3
MSIHFEESAFSTIQKRHIFTVYGGGDQAEVMFNALLGSPQEALPVVRERLISKGAEWAKVGTSSCLLVLKNCSWLSRPKLDLVC